MLENLVVLALALALCAVIGFILRDMARDRKTKQKWEEAERRRRRQEQIIGQRNRDEIARNLGKL